MKQIQRSDKGELLAMGHNNGGRTAIFVLDCNAVAPRLIFESPVKMHVLALGSIPAPMPGSTDNASSDETEAAYLVAANGNQTFLYEIIRYADGRIERLSPQPAIMPMRRFGGRALLERGKYMVYDSGATEPIWVPLLTQVRRQYSTENSFSTRIFDGAEPQCVWDRIRLDACIPPGTDIKIEARVHDDQEVLSQMGEAGWLAQPSFYLNRDGGELPGKRAIAQLATDSVSRSGSWDMLLQNLSGRYVQFRITMTGDGRHTPSLRSMRIWYPRFSYSERFLPAVFREEPQSASFLDRYLASLEGINTVIEGRIADAQAMFDARIARQDMLEWLASWFDVVMDPSWTEYRQRLFLKHAAILFGWRGTIAGVKMALRLAFDEKLTDADFVFGGPDCTCPNSIRIVEAFSTRAKGKLHTASTLSGLQGPQSLALQDVWMPSSGAAALFARWPEASEPLSPDGRFPLFANGVDDNAWVDVTTSCFGFVPTTAAAERLAWQAYQEDVAGSVVEADLPESSYASRDDDGLMLSRWQGFLGLSSRNRNLWQDYLRRRYRSVTAFNAAWHKKWADFSEISLPDYLPTQTVAISDWLQFEGQLLTRQTSAHRFSVLLPLNSVNANADELAAKMALAKRIVDIEKPAHTIFDVRLFWAMNRVGEARIGQDTLIGAGSRALELIPQAIIGQAYLGSAFVGGPQGRQGRRDRLAC